jgi:hypothetical protein
VKYRRTPNPGAALQLGCTLNPKLSVDIWIAEVGQFDEGFLVVPELRLPLLLFHHNGGLGVGSPPHLLPLHNLSRLPPLSLYGNLDIS